MLKQKTAAGTHPKSAPRTGRSADNLVERSVPFPEWLLYCRPHGIDRDSTRLLLCKGANRSLGRHFVNGQQNGGSAMHSSNKSVAKGVGYLQYLCVARLCSRCATNCLGQKQGPCQSPATAVERLHAGALYRCSKPAEAASLLDRLVPPVAGHKFFRYAAVCSQARQGGSA